MEFTAYVSEICPDGLASPLSTSATPRKPYIPGSPVQRIESISSSSFNSSISIGLSELISTITFVLCSFARAIIWRSYSDNANGRSKLSPEVVFTISGS